VSEKSSTQDKGEGALDKTKGTAKDKKGKVKDLLK
jgi:uncharacterized protein YjbJ (UPF0337 family)